MKIILDLKGISKYLNISESMIRKLVRERKIPYFRIGNRLKFDINEVNKWIKESQEKETLNSVFF